MGYWPYKKLFEEFRPNDCDIFVETGTYKGDSVQDALDLGFKVVISVEKNKTFYQECFKSLQKVCTKFSNNPKRFLNVSGKFSARFYNISKKNFFSTDQRFPKHPRYRKSV